MSLNTTLCHPEADSLASVAAADVYMAGNPDAAAWDGPPGADEEEKTSRKEKFLSEASRMVCRAPLSQGSLSRSLGWVPGQGLAVPVAGHRVHYGIAESGGGTALVDVDLADRPKEAFVGGAIRFGSGEVIGVEDFDPETGAITLARTPDTEVFLGTPFALIEGLDLMIVHAVCEQALYLAGNPNLAALDRMEQGIAALSASGPGAGAITLGRAPETGELCFAARRLLTKAGLLLGGHSLPAGRA